MVSIEIIWANKATQERTEMYCIIIAGHFCTGNKSVIFFGFVMFCNMVS